MIRVIALAALLLLVACGTTATPGAGQAPGSITTTAIPAPLATTSATATPAPAATPRPSSVATPRPATPLPASPTAALDGPPPLILAYGTATRSARPHSAAWTTPGGGGMILDGAPVLSKLETLTVPHGATLTFAAPELSGPTAATVQAYGVVNGQLRYSTPSPASLPTRLTAQGATIAADLAPGEYLLLVNLTWGNNQASYGFLVAVVAETAPTPPAPPLGWPPVLELSYAGTTRHARAVSTVWITDTAGVIGDGFPSPDGSETLVAPAGARLTLNVGSILPLTGIDVRPYPIVAGRSQTGAPYLPYLPVDFAGSAPIVTAALAPGDYLLDIIVHWGMNRAGYGFRLTITP